MTLTGLSRTNADFYDVVVSDGNGSTVSALAQLTVAPSAYPGLVAMNPAWAVRAELLGSGIYAIYAAPDGSFYAAGTPTVANSTSLSGVFHVLANGTPGHGIRSATH